MIFRGLQFIRITFFFYLAYSNGREKFQPGRKGCFGVFFLCLKCKSLWLFQVENDKIKRRKRKEVNGLRPRDGTCLYSESEQWADFGIWEILIF